nr:unnamed protein product [Callosobruchus analis]
MEWRQLTNLDFNDFSLSEEDEVTTFWATVNNYSNLILSRFSTYISADIKPIPGTSLISTKDHTQNSPLLPASGGELSQLCPLPRLTPQPEVGWGVPDGRARTFLLLALVSGLKGEESTCLLLDR